MCEGTALKNCSIICQKLPMNNRPSSFTSRALLYAVLFSLSATSGSAQTNEALRAATLTTTAQEDVADQEHVSDRIQETVSEYVREKAEDLDQSLDDMLTPQELERSRTFDRFFGDRRRADDDQRSRLKIVPRVEWSEANDITTKIKFKLKLDLPRTKDRIQLVADNLGEDRSALSAFSESVSRPESSEREEDTSIALRTELGEKFNIRFRGDLGLKFRPEPVPKLKLRARLPWNIGNWQIHLSETLFWEGRDGFGEKTSLDFERFISTLTSVELSSAAVWSETSEGVDLGQSVNLNYFPGRGRRMSVKLGVEAHTEPTFEVDRYLVRCPLSQKTHKDWMYVVVEPGADFPVERDYKFSPLIIFKIELIFGDLPTG